MSVSSGTSGAGVGNVENDGRSRTISEEIPYKCSGLRNVLTNATVHAD